MIWDDNGGILHDICNKAWSNRLEFKRKNISAFANIDNLSQKILITNDYIDYSTSIVKYIKLKDFLLMESLD